MNVANGKTAFLQLGALASRNFAFSNLSANDAGYIEIRQDSVGSRTINWPAGHVPATGGLGLSIGPNEVTIIGYIWTGSTLYLFKENFGTVAPGDTTPPTVVSLRVENATPNRIDVLYNETLNGASVPANGQFTPSGGRTVTGVAIVGSTTQITVNTPYAAGDTITLGYTVPGSNPIEDVAGNNAAAIAAGTAVTNAISGGGYQAETIAAISAIEGGGTTLTTGQKNAMDAAIVRFKAIGWAKFDVINGYVNSTAQAHKWNWKNPLDTDAAFRQTFSGITNNASGITGNGSSSFVSTKFIPGTHGNANDFHMMISISAGSPNGRHGCNSDSNANNLLFVPSLAANTDYFRCWGTGDDGQITAGNTTVAGRYGISRRAANDFEAYRNAASSGNKTGTTNVGAPPSTEIYLCAENANGTPGSFADHTVNFITIGKGLTDAEMAEVDDIMADFNTAVSR